MVFSKYFLVLAMAVLVATSNHQVHGYGCADVQLALSLTCDNLAGGVLGLTTGLLGGLPIVGGVVTGLLPTGGCCTNVNNAYNQCVTAQLDITACLSVLKLNLVELCAILKTCGISATACINV